jgi:hypothetical protein
MKYISSVTVRFEDGKGSYLERTYRMIPETTFMKGNNPQGKVLGDLKVFGKFTCFIDKTNEG